MSDKMPPALTAPAIEMEDRTYDDPQMMEILNKKPGLHYRWIRCSAHDNFLAVQRAKLRGYKPVKKEEITTIAEIEDKGDGLVHIGDSLLMACKTEVYERRVAKKRQRREQILASATATTEEMARKKGIKLIPDADHNKETRD